MDVLRSALVLLGILAVTGCHHGYHHGGPGWYDPGYGACVPPEDGYYDGWAMPPMPWDTDPRMARRARRQRHHDRHRPRHAHRGDVYPAYGPEVLPCGSCGVCDTCGIAGGPGMVVSDGMMVGSACGCETGQVIPGQVIPGEVIPGEILPGTMVPEMTMHDGMMHDGMMHGTVMPGGMMPPQNASGHCEHCQKQHAHHGMHPTPDSPPQAPAKAPTPNCAHCNETTQWQQFPSTAPAVPPVDDYYVPSTDVQAPAPLPQQKAGEPVQPVMWVPSEFDGR